MNQVQELFSANDITPDTDLVNVLSPEEVNYELSVKYFISRENATQAAYISSQVQSAIESWVKWQHGKLGRDINPSELNYRIIQAGAERSIITSPEFRILEDYQISKCVNQNIEFGGLE